MKAGFVYSPEFGRFFIREDHPWYTTRSDVCFNLCQRYALLEQDGISVVAPRVATRAELEVFHTPDYLNLLLKANQNVFEEEMLASGIGITECPVFKGVYDYNALLAGASLTAADLILSEQADVIFSPTGGMHHAGPDFAAGFCYVNDAVLSIKRFLKRGLRVLYVDLDAHHGDQVQAAFYDSDQVFCLSFHESPRTLFPFETGYETELGREKGEGYNVNVPLPSGTSDEVFSWAFKEVYPPIVERFRPDVVIGIFGMDVVYSDPMSDLLLTNNATTEAVEMVARSADKLLAFGCGGYVLDNLARGWTLAWAAMTGQEISNDQSLTLGGVFLGDQEVSLLDAPHVVPEKTLGETRAEIERVVTFLKKECPFLSE